jgi:hypothetical protein
MTLTNDPSAGVPLQPGSTTRVLTCSAGRAIEKSRSELRIALEEWHRRIPEYELADREPISEYVGAVAGLAALPLRWPVSPAPAPRGGHDD